MESWQGERDEIKIEGSRPNRGKTRSVGHGKKNDGDRENLKLRQERKQRGGRLGQTLSLSEANYRGTAPAPGLNGKCGEGGNYTRI